jgi:hypothetical protein
MRKLKCLFKEHIRETKRQYAWNPNWVYAFESPWGIFEKFKYANRLNTIELLSIFGNDDVNQNMIISCNRKNCDLFHMERLSNEAITRNLYMDVRSINKENMNLLTSVPSHSRYQELYRNHPFRKHLMFCPKCIKYGYHSILHQFIFIHECPIHGEKLSQHCPRCSQSYPYRLSDQGFNEPFQCSCGYNFLYQIFNYSIIRKFGKGLNHKLQRRKHLIGCQIGKVILMTNGFYFSGD